MPLVARQYYNICYNSVGQAYQCSSSWYDWGRWVALGAIILGAFFLFFFCACISSRRRRKAGRRPYYGTGWAGQTPWGHGPATYNPNYQTQQPNNPPPPNYAQNTQNYGGYYGENQGYFGGRTTDVEMQPPQNAYRAGGEVYSPPPGPPPEVKR